MDSLGVLGNDTTKELSPEYIYFKVLSEISKSVIVCMVEISPNIDMVLGL